MPKRALSAILCTILFTLLMAGVVLAMSSANYRLDWFTPLTGGGGGEASSANYAANLTIGQAVNGVAASPSNQVCLGYWCGSEVEYSICLPIVMRAEP
jgi:hypothetical protein